MRELCAGTMVSYRIPMCKCESRVFKYTNEGDVLRLGHDVGVLRHFSCLCFFQNSTCGVSGFSMWPL